MKMPWKRLHKYEYQPYLHKNNCLYFYMDSYEIGIQAFKLLSEFDDYSSIEMVEGKHGMELVSADLESIATNKAWLILGTAQDSNAVEYPDNLMIWTAYPGELTASIKNVPDFDGTFNCLIQAAKHGFPIAVKRV